MIQEGFHTGLMRKTAILKTNTPINNDSGGQDDGYSNTLTTRCYLKKDGGSTNLLTGQIVFNKNYTMICRYQVGIMNVLNVDSAWTIDGEEYVTQDWEEIDEIPHLLVFKLSKDAGG